MSTADIDLTASKQQELRATAYSITVLAGVFVALRFVARAKRGAGLKIDDWMLVVALVSIRRCFGGSGGECDESEGG